MIDLQKCADTLTNYLVENQVHGAPCCETAPQIIAECTPWGIIGTIIKCRTCGATRAAPGVNHIEAFNKALTAWNNRGGIIYEK